MVYFVYRSAIVEGINYTILQKPSAILYLFNTSGKIRILLIMKLKLLILFVFALASHPGNSQVLTYDIFSYQNCIYDKKKKTYGDCKTMEGHNYWGIEVDKNKKVIRYSADNAVKTYQIKKTTVLSSSTIYFVSDESGMTWLYYILNADDEDYLELQVWRCNKKGVPNYILGKASVGIWEIGELDEW
jgi:hypothetical protein